MTHNKPISRRVKMLVRRHLALMQKGKAAFDKANEALTLAINNGLAVDQPIDLDVPGADGRPQKEQFQLVNNFAGEVVYRPARCPKFEFKRIPKFKRTKPVAEEAAASS